LVYLSLTGCMSISQS